MESLLHFEIIEVEIHVGVIAAGDGLISDVGVVGLVPWCIVVFSPGRSLRDLSLIF